MKKRALSLLLAFVMTLGLAVPAIAAEAPEAPAGLEEPEAPVPVPVEEEEPVAEPAANDEPAPASYDEPAPASLTAGDGDVYQIEDDIALGELFVEAAKSPDVMFNAKLTASVEISAYKNFTSGKVTLDMGGFGITRTGSGTTVFQVGDAAGSTTASLTLTGSGVITNEASIQGVIINVVKGGTLTLAKGGNVSVKATGECFPIEAQGGTINMENGTVEGVGVPAVLVVKGSTMTLSGGELSTNCGSAVIQVGQQGDNTVNTLTMTGGTLTNSFEGADEQGYTGGDILAYGKSSTATISGGTVHNVTASNEGTVTVQEGATINATHGFACLARENGKLNIEGGTVTSAGVAVGTNGKDAAKPATITISGGTVTGTVGAYMPSGKLEVKGGSLVGEAGIVARQGTVTISSGTVVGTSSNGKGVVGDATPAEGEERYDTDYGAIVVDKATKGYEGGVTVTISGDTAKIKGAADDRVLVYTKDGKITELPADSNPFTISGGHYSHSVKDFVKAESLAYELDAGTGDARYSYIAGEKTAAQEKVRSGDAVAYRPTAGEEDTWYRLNDIKKVDPETTLGTLTIDKEKAFSGDEVKVTVTVTEDHKALGVSVKGNTGDVPVTTPTPAGENGAGDYTFQMPNEPVTVSALIVEKTGDENDELIVDEPTVELAPVPSTVPDEVKNNATQMKVETTEEAAKEIETELTAVGESAVEEYKTEEGKSVEEALVEEVLDARGQEVFIRVVTTMETTIEGYTEDEGEMVLKLDITPKAVVYATTAATGPIKTDKAGGQNAIVVKNDVPVEITKPVEITVPVPNEFATAAASKDNSLFIEHIKGTKSYWYTGKVAGNVVTFTNPNGFSEFAIRISNGAAASVDGVGYSTLQDAVDEAKRTGDKVVLNNADKLSEVTVNSTGQFTVDANNTGVDKAKLEGLIKSSYNVSVTDNGDNTFTVNVYTTSFGGGGGGTTAVDKSALKAAIAAAQALKGEEYTTDSWSALETALAAARTVDDNAAATQAQVNAALAALTTARSGLVKKGEEPGPSGEILPPAGGTGWRWVEDEQTYYYFKDGKRVGDYWIGFADGGSAWANNWYYADANGRLLTGFQYLDDLKGGKAWYMLQTDNTNGTMGKMLTGWQWTYITAVGTGYFSPKYGSQGACTYTTEWGEYNAATGLWGDGQSHTGK